MANDLSGKVALVTGAGRGIGRAIAQRLAASGALVFVNYVSNKDAAQDAVAAIRTAGGTALSVQADLANPGSIAELFVQIDTALSESGHEPKIDIVVNNAGVPVFGDVAHTTVEALDSVLGVNVRGTFLVVQHALSRIRNEGRVINISSAAARRSEGAMAAYSISKAAIETMTVILARDLGSRRITVNAVAPGWVETDINAKARSDAALVAQVVLQGHFRGRYLPILC